MFSLKSWKKKNGRMAVRGDRDGNSRLLRLREEVEALWDSFWKEMDRGFRSGMRSGQPSSRGTWRETDSDFFVEVELPGFDINEIDLKVSGTTLMLSAEHHEHSATAERTMYRRGKYEQSFRVPQGVVVDQIDARYRNGILEIRLPKSEQGRARRIHVESS